MGRFGSSDEVYAFLNRYLNFERKLEPTEYRLDRMRMLHAVLGQPDRAYRVIHVAGSKGKGSTAAMMAAILAENGSRVGLFTSPHLLSFTERIMVDGAPVEDAILFQCAESIASLLDKMGPEDFPGGENPTYFELLTALGFLCFREAGCEWAVIEVGLGGRLDSTNVVLPEACAITPIELEHTELLGTTIAAIAAEKAGIMKAGVPAYTSAKREDALTVFRETAARLGSRLRILGEEALIDRIGISAEGTRARVSLKDRSLSAEPLLLHSPMIGAVQAENASLAAMVCLDLGVSPEAVLAGILKASLPARFQIVAGRPTVVLDGAHTADSVRSCVDDFAALFPGGGMLLFGCAKDKDARSMAAELRRGFSELTLTKPGTFKESDLPAMKEAFEAAGLAVTVVEDTGAAIRAAFARADERGLPLLVCGSFYLCAEAARLLQGAVRGRG